MISSPADMIPSSSGSTPAWADVNADLNGYFSSLGYSGNVSKAQAWQATGFATGESLYLGSGQAGAADVDAGTVSERGLRWD